MNTDRNNKRRRILLIIPIIGIVAGLLLLLYPFIMNQYNEYRNSKAISSMSSVYDRYEDNKEQIEEQLVQAEMFNRKLAGDAAENEIWDYERQLSFDGNGVMGYLSIPDINIKMLIYHGTDDDTLAVGVGHLEGTSLPVGGVSTHCVLTAHSGMKTMKAFDDLRKLKNENLFCVTVLGREYWYKVDSIDTVLPHETDSLQIMEGEDRMTLVTCTPYGINDHRLLVHGIRCEAPKEDPVDTEVLTDIENPEGQFNLKEFLEFDIWTTPVLVIGGLSVICLIVLTVKVIRKRKSK